jgi:hypothetical protein
MSSVVARPKNTIVTITDHNYLVVVYLLLLSLSYHRVRANVNILCVELRDEEKEFLAQFPNVRLFDGDPNNKRNPATRKAEAILTAESQEVDYVTLLDGDGLVTGDITPYLSPGEGFSSRTKSPMEEETNFRTYYEPGETRGGIPRKVLRAWREDVGEADEPRICNTVTSGNLTVHRSCFNFIRKWHAQMMRVLPLEDPGMPYHIGNPAYPQMDESVLNSLLAFADDAPVLFPGLLNIDPKAHVAHLGPAKPRPWVLLRYEKLKYFRPIVDLAAWAKDEGYRVPPLPWTFRRGNKPAVYTAAYLYLFSKKVKHLLADIHHSTLTPPYNT